MSYSRWGRSRWYTYWCSVFKGDIDQKAKRQKKYQTFTICCVADFYYHELKSDMRKCVDQVLKVIPDATEDELIELKIYMWRFIQDVEKNETLH